MSTAGLKAKAIAQAAGLAAIFDAAGGNVEMAKFYLALDRGLFVDLAKQTASAVQGLNPKLNIWNTGAPGMQQHSSYQGDQSLHRYKMHDQIKNRIA